MAPPGGRRRFSLGGQQPEGHQYLDAATYDCGPHAAFVDADTGDAVEEDELLCLWTKEWAKQELLECKRESNRSRYNNGWPQKERVTRLFSLAYVY